MKKDRRTSPLMVAYTDTFEAYTDLRVTLVVFPAVGAIYQTLPVTMSHRKHTNGL